MINSFYDKDDGAGAFMLTTLYKRLNFKAPSIIKNATTPCCCLVRYLVKYFCIYPIVVYGSGNSGTTTSPSSSSHPPSTTRTSTTGIPGLP